MHLKRVEHHQCNPLFYLIGRQEICNQLLHGQVHRAEREEEKRRTLRPYRCQDQLHRRMLESVNGQLTLNDILMLFYTSLLLPLSVGNSTCRLVFPRNIFWCLWKKSGQGREFTRRHWKNLKGLWSEVFFFAYFTKHSVGPLFFVDV